MAEPQHPWMVIASASSGRALRARSVISRDLNAGKGKGIYRGSHSTSVQHDQLEGKELLLEAPKDLQSLSGARLPEQAVWFHFSNSEEASVFRKDVMEKGWSVAFNMQLKNVLCSMAGFNGSLEWKNPKVNQTTEEKIEKKVHSAYMTRCLYIPMKSFQIPAHSMRLCEAALATARRVNSLRDALNFLDAYGSHVSRSLYHLGGVFFEELNVISEEVTNLTDLLRKVVQGHIRGNASATFPGFSAAATMMSSSGPHESNTEVTSSVNRKQMSRQSVIAFGPTNVKDEKEFRCKLEESALSWAIIDKVVDQQDDLEGVWDIILRNHATVKPDDHQYAAKNLESAARLLCEAWLNEANSGEVPDKLIGLIGRGNQLLRQLSASDPQLSVQPRLNPLAPKWVSPVLELPQQLDLQVVQLHQASNNMSGLAEPIVKSCITHLRSERSSDRQQQLKHIVGVITQYGFNESGYSLRPMNSQHLRSMIDDLKQPKVKSSNYQAPDNSPSWNDASWPQNTLSLNDDHSHLPTFRYIGDVMVDQPLKKELHPPLVGQAHAYGRQLLLIDRLRRSINPFQRPTLEGRGAVHQARKVESKWGKEKQKVSDQAAQGDGLASECPFGDLVQIMQSSDLPAQVAVCKFLLDQRAASPLVFPNYTPPEAAATGRTTDLSWTHCVEALSFVEVRLPDEKRSYIAEDITLPRVAFLSNMKVQKSKTAIVARRAVKCHFPSRHMSRKSSHLLSTPVVEVGVGFVNSKPVLAFHVEGPYDKLMDFVKGVQADVIVLEAMEQVDIDSHLECDPSTITVQWISDVEDSYDTDTRAIWGNEIMW